MTRENTLFAIIGLLLGYIIAFHLVVYINQNQPQLRGVEASADEDLASDNASSPTNDAKDKQRLQSTSEQASKIAREDPKNFDAQFKAGEASLDAGDAEGAIDFLTRANSLRPTDYDTLVRLGNANFEAKHFDTAERWYKEALVKKPEDVDVRSDLGLTYFLRKPPQAEKAVAEFRRALEYDPAHVPTLHNLTLVLKEMGDLDGAEATLAKLEQADPQSNGIPRLREELEKARREAASKPGAGAKAQKKSPTD